MHIQNAMRYIVSMHQVPGHDREGMPLPHAQDQDVDKVLVAGGGLARGGSAMLGLMAPSSLGLSTGEGLVARELPSECDA